MHRHELLQLIGLRLSRIQKLLDAPFPAVLARMRCISGAQGIADLFASIHHAETKAAAASFTQQGKEPPCHNVETSPTVTHPPLQPDLHLFSNALAGDFNPLATIPLPTEGDWKE